MVQLRQPNPVATRPLPPHPYPLQAVMPPAFTGEKQPRAMIEIQDVSKIFGVRGSGGVAAITEITIRIPENSMTLIKGPSGSGKTTLLGIVGCMVRPTAGRVTVSGHDVTRLSEDNLAEMRRTHFGFVFQTRHLIRRATALENVMVPGLPCRDRNGNLRERARSLLGNLGLESMVHRRVEHLSGGEQQRVALARALVNEPQIIVADEPTAHLDADSARSFMKLTSDLLSIGKSVIIASHDPAVCRSALFTHVVELRGGRLA